MSVVTRTTSDSEVRELLNSDGSDVSTSPAKRSRMTHSTVALRIAGVLQTTLDINQLLTLFGQQIAPAIHQIGLRYTYDDADLNLSLGQTDTDNVFTHELMVSGSPLGTLHIFRDKPFNKGESAFLEYAMFGLFFPLRNAILYFQALNLAHRDPLTGLHNRASLNDNLRREIDLAKRREDPLSLLVIDIDHFKKINDMHGHSTGDFVIRSVADAIRECLRSSDMLFRWGGEEFVVVLTNTEIAGAVQVAERIRATIEQTAIRNGGGTLITTVSIGATPLLPDDTELSLFKRADVALLRAKAAGRNQVESSDSQEAAAA